MGITTVGIRTAVAAGAALLMSGLAAHALDTSAKASSKLSADALWAKIGDFCGIGKWHPAVEKCELSADGKTRTLSLKGGGTIVEALVKMDAAGRAYTYSIVSAPIPVANYTSTIAVSADGAGSVVNWSGKYDAKGASDADAQKVIQGIYDAGLKALTE
jgi:Polyketide cyclase / dehydrase and lipid transport